MRIDLCEEYDGQDLNSQPPVSWPAKASSKTPGKAPGGQKKTVGHPLFHELLEKMRDIHNAKNADYGAGKVLGNFMEAARFGVDPFKGVLIRLSDKYSRIASLSIKENMTGEVKDESIEDTLLDNAIYSLLAIVVRRETR